MRLDCTLITAPQGEGNLADLHDDSIVRGNIQRGPCNEAELTWVTHSFRAHNSALLRPHGRRPPLARAHLGGLDFFQPRPLYGAIWQPIASKQPLRTAARPDGEGGIVRPRATASVGTS
eukprot:scaffold693_cov399-Prasinococcus_capsulatus_cf.AAC.17